MLAIGPDADNRLDGPFLLWSKKHDGCFGQKLFEMLTHVTKRHASIVLPSNKIKHLTCENTSQLSLTSGISSYCDMVQMRPSPEKSAALLDRVDV